jgi:hypothetical protein
VEAGFERIARLFLHEEAIQLFCTVHRRDIFFYTGSISTRKIYRYRSHPWRLSPSHACDLPGVACGVHLRGTESSRFGLSLKADRNLVTKGTNSMKSQAVKSKWLITLCGLALALGIFAPRTYASEWDKRTIVTVNQPMQVRETLLQPGTYVFKLLDSNSDRHVVQIFNGEQTQIINTVLAIPSERRLDQVTGHTDFTFWETPAGYAKALRDWYYPGDSIGQEFTYPKHLSVIQTAAVTTLEPPPPAMTPVPETKTETQPETQPDQPVAMEPEQQPEQPAQVAQATPPPTTPPAPEAQPATPAEPPANLPKTASPFPLIGLGGLLSLGLSSVVRRKSLA